MTLIDKEKLLSLVVLAVLMCGCKEDAAPKGHITVTITNSYVIDFPGITSVIYKAESDFSFPAFEGVITNGETLNVIAPDGGLRTITASGVDRYVLLWSDGTEETRIKRHPDGSYEWTGH